MKCIICSSQMSFFFSKSFDTYDLAQVDYWKCQSCGFVISKTHADLSDSDWKKLNYKYHNSFLGKNFNTDDPRWINRLNVQAEIIDDLVNLGVLPNTKWLDFASGDGKLSALLKNKYKLTLLNYDKYTPTGDNFLAEKDLTPLGFDFVITTSVFEHIVKRDDYDYIASLITKDGIMGLHTLVREDIPNDPNWFYLLPVHCAFHTNKSMNLLLQQWGYKSSIYNVDARLWLFFKSKSDNIETMIAKANKRALSKPKYLFKNGFMDYWK